MSVVYSKMQRTSAPDIDDLKDKRIEIKYIYTEPDGSKVNVWVRGVVDALCVEDDKNDVIIRWDTRYLDPKEIERKEFTLPVPLPGNKWNKQMEGAWRFCHDE